MIVTGRQGERELAFSVVPAQLPKSKERTAREIFGETARDCAHPKIHIFPRTHTKTEVREALLHRAIAVADFGHM